MELPWTTLLPIIQTAAILFGIPVIAFRLGQGTAALRLSIEHQATIVSQLAVELSELKREQREFRQVIIQIAAQTVRLDTHGQQITGLQKELSDLRRGEGFIFPLAHLTKP